MGLCSLKKKPSRNPHYKPKRSGDLSSLWWESLCQYDGVLVNRLPGTLLPLPRDDAKLVCYHYDDVIMGVLASQITSRTIVYSTIHSSADQRKHQSSASLAFVRGIRPWPVNPPHKWPVTLQMFPFDDVIMILLTMNNRIVNHLSSSQYLTCSVIWYISILIKD